MVWLYQVHFSGWMFHWFKETVLWVLISFLLNLMQCKYYSKSSWSKLETLQIADELHKWINYRNFSMKHTGSRDFFCFPKVDVSG